MFEVEIRASKTERRVAARSECMPIGDQLEAVIDFARVLQAQGYDVGEKMSVLINSDNNVRNLVK